MGREKKGGEVEGEGETGMTIHFGVAFAEELFVRPPVSCPTSDQRLK